MNELHRYPVSLDKNSVQRFVFSIKCEGGTGYFFLRLDPRWFIMEFKIVPEESASQGNTEIRKPP